MIFQKIKKIPEIDSYFYYRIKRKLFIEKYVLKILNHLEIEQNSIQKEKKKFFKDFWNIFLNNKFDFSFGKNNITGKYLCLEKKGLRIRTNSQVLNLLNLKDFKNLTNSKKIIQKRLLNEFQILKIFEYIRSEYAILSNTKIKFLKARQKLKQCKEFSFTFFIKPEKWIPNKGLWANYIDGFLFNPYSKTPPNLKNKDFQNIDYPSKIKEFYFEPIPKKYFRYFLILDIKKKIWIIQSKKFKTNFKFLGSIYLYKFPYAFIVGIQGIPVLLHRNQLFLSCREMKKFKSALKFTEFFFLRVFAKYKSEKRINVIIENRILYSKFFELKMKILNKTIFYYNNYIYQRKNFVN